MIYSLKMMPYPKHLVELVSVQQLTRLAAGSPAAAAREDPDDDDGQDSAGKPIELLKQKHSMTISV